MKYPKNYCDLSIREQELSFAGDANLPMNKDYLKKSNCKSKAKELIDSGQVTGMSQLQIAQEIYAHAFCYYAASALIDAGIDADIVEDIKSMGEVVDIANNGDTAWRQAAYLLIWAVTEPVVV